MPAEIQVVLGRILAAVVSALLVWLGAKGIDTKGWSVEAIVSAMLAIFGVLYSIGHTIYNAKFNKKDVSSPSLLPSAQEDAKRIESGESYGSTR